MGIVSTLAVVVSLIPRLCLVTMLLLLLTLKDALMMLSSAGVGRSGTLIALDKLLNEAAEKQSIDLLKCIEGLRMQRMYMVQTLVNGRYICTLFCHLTYTLSAVCFVIVQHAYACSFFKLQTCSIQYSWARRSSESQIGLYDGLSLFVRDHRAYSTCCKRNPKQVWSESYSHIHMLN